MLDWFQFQLFCLLAALINLLPFSVAVTLSRWIGRGLFFGITKRRLITLQSLRLAYPEKSEEEIRQIGMESFMNMVQFGMEFARFPKLLKENKFDFEGKGIIHELLKLKKGIIVIVAHITNWEAVAINCGKFFPSAAIGRPLKNRYFYEHVRYLRGLTGTTSIDKSGAIREVLKELKKNKLVGFLIDQHERQGAVRVNFFGKPCMTSSLPARIASKWNIPVVTCFCYRDSKGNLITKAEGPIPIVSTENEEEDILTNTQAIVGAIEKEVRKRPGEWLWMHRRWRV